MQVYTGSYRAKKKKAPEPQKRAEQQVETDVNNAEDCAPDAPEFVAFEHKMWSDKPLLGQVVAKKESVTTVHWWLGRYRGPWKPCTDENKLEDIPNEDIVYTFYWNTSGSNRLPKEATKGIREAYKNSDFTF